MNSIFPPEKPDISKQHERLPIVYYLLTILHDKIYEYDDLVTPISVDIWSLDAEWIESLWEQMKKSSIAIADGDAVFFDKIDRALQLVEKDLPKPPAEKGRNEIVEVKPGAFGITVNIKEIARRIWNWVCSRRI